MAENVLDSRRKRKHQKSERSKKIVVKKEIQHEQYKEALFERKQFCHGMNIL